MNRFIATLAALALASPVIAAPAHRSTPASRPAKPLAPPTAKAAPSLPVFEFLGQRTDAPRSMTDLQGKPCTTKDAKTTCANYSFPTVAGRPMRYLVLEFLNDRLYMVSASFGEQAYQPVADAFTAKYGQPGKVEVRKWQSKGGATFDNRVMIWKFSGGGTLELESMGNEVGAGRYIFTSTTNAPPADAPKVDF